MSDGQRIPHNVGLRMAERLFALLGGTFERAAVAGSLRRGKTDIGDIELVLKPTFIDGLNLLEERTADLLREGTLTLSRKSNGSLKANGERYKAFLFEAMPVDLFIVLPDRHWGPTLLIRTGPGDANQVLVTTVGTRTRDGLRGILPRELAFRDGGVWDEGHQLHTPEEIDVLHACGLPWIPPNERTVERYQDMASGESCEFVAALARWPVLKDTQVHSPGGSVVDVRLPEAVPSGGRVVQGSLF